MTAEPHEVHADLRQLVRTGILMNGSSAFEPGFRSLRSTSAAGLFDLKQLPQQLLVARDYVCTVTIPTGSRKKDHVSDSYQRPVQRILSVVDCVHPSSIKHLIILSPYEANELQSSIDSSGKVTLHMFAPRFNASFAPLDDLTLYNIGRHFTPGQLPQSLRVQLNLFTGSLYLRSLVACRDLCELLGLLHGTLHPGQHVFADGFIDPPCGRWGLKTSLVQFLRALLMKIRKEGEGVEKTHMGRLLGGVRLEESDFEGDVSQV